MHQLFGFHEVFCVSSLTTFWHIFKYSTTSWVTLTGAVNNGFVVLFCFNIHVYTQMNICTFHFLLHLEVREMIRGNISISLGEPHPREIAQPWCYHLLSSGYLYPMWGSFAQSCRDFPPFFAVGNFAAKGEPNGSVFHDWNHQAQNL